MLDIKELTRFWAVSPYIMPRQEYLCFIQEKIYWLTRNGVLYTLEPVPKGVELFATKEEALEWKVANCRKMYTDLLSKVNETEYKYQSLKKSYDYLTGELRKVKEEEESNLG